MPSPVVTGAQRMNQCCRSHLLSTRSPQLSLAQHQHAMHAGICELRTTACTLHLRSEQLGWAGPPCNLNLPLQVDASATVSVTSHLHLALMQRSQSFTAPVQRSKDACTKLTRQAPVCTSTYRCHQLARISLSRWHRLVQQLCLHPCLSQRLPLPPVPPLPPSRWHCPAQRLWPHQCPPLRLLPPPLPSC